MNKNICCRCVLNKKFKKRYASTIETSRKYMEYKIILRGWGTLFDLDSIIQLSNRFAKTISQLCDSSGISEINPFHFRRPEGFFSLPFWQNKLTMWARESCSVESLMVEEAICCHVLHVSTMLAQCRNIC